MLVVFRQKDLVQPPHVAPFGKRHADAHGAEPEPFDLLSQPLGEQDGFVFGHVRHDDDELVASVASDQVWVAHGGLQDVRQVFQHLVGRQMAELVVEALEPVDVEHEDGERLL